MNSTERILDFVCRDKHLVGIAHIPEHPIDTGLVCVVARGAQYRVGCCRQLVILARDLAHQGVAVMRFDYRGLGDAAGTLPGDDRSDDIGAAIDAFLAATPGIKKVVLYGGCDGASAVAVSGWRHPAVTGWILSNPSIGQAGTGSKAEARVMLKHYYLDRLRSREFWDKVLHLRLDVSATLKSLQKTAGDAFRRNKKDGEHSALDPFDQSRSIADRMLAGWQRFDGEVLLLIGGRSVVARIFDEWVAASKEWQARVSQPHVARVELKDADHTYSEPRSRAALSAAIGEWFLSRNQPDR